MIITPASLDATFVGFNTRFQQGFALGQPVASLLATEIPSSGEANVYAWMTNIMRMRKWVGERVLQNISSKTYTLTNEPYELSIEVPRAKIVDDQLGVYSPLFEEMGREMKLWLDDLLVTQIKNADDATLGAGWDGVPFFSASHPIDLDGRVTGTQSNKLVAADLDETTVDAARIALSTLKLGENRIIGTRMTHLIVPPQLTTKAKKVVTAQNNAAGATNVLAGLAQVIELPQLADEPTTWYAVDLSRVIKPFITQVREAPDFASRTSIDSEPVFNRDAYQFGSKARGAAGLGLYFTAIRNAPTGI